MIQKIITALDGLKTYIVATTAFLTLVAYAMGLFDKDTLELFMMFLASGGLVTLRAGIAKSSK